MSNLGLADARPCGVSSFAGLLDGWGDKNNQSCGTASQQGRATFSRKCSRQVDSDRFSRSYYYELSQPIWHADCANITETECFIQ